MGNTNEMGNFTKWLKRTGRLSEDINSDPTDKFKFNSDGDTPRDYERDCQELTKDLITRYHTEFFQFVKQLSDERGDDELGDLLEKIQLEKKKTPDGDWKPSHYRDPDIVSVPKADRGADTQGGSNT
jgi:hypothetical protein